MSYIKDTRGGGSDPLYAVMQSVYSTTPAYGA